MKVSRALRLLPRRLRPCSWHWVGGWVGGWVGWVGKQQLPRIAFSPSIHPPTYLIREEEEEGV